MAAVNLARVYQQSFDTHPNMTLAITGGCLNALGDFVAQVTQNVLRRRSDQEYRRYDFVRTLRFFCYGFTISPFFGRWNAFLETRFPLRTIGSTGRISYLALSKRVAADQLFMSPIGITLFFGSMGIMEGRTSGQIREKFRGLYSQALISNWRVWPVAQFVNFGYTPLAYRVPFSQSCGVFWTLYLSLLNSEEDDVQDAKLALRRIQQRGMV